MKVKVDESRDELLCRAATLSREVSAMVHGALGLPPSPSRCDLELQITTLGVRCVSQLQIGECSEAVRAVLICCFLRQVRAIFGRYDESVNAFSFGDYLEMIESAPGVFLDSVCRGYVVNVKRHDRFSNGRIVRAKIKVSDGMFEMVYLE